MIKLNEKQVCDLYLSGSTANQLKIKFNLKTSSPIKTILTKNGIQIRGIREVNKKYSFNEDYFEKIDSEDKAYFLGLLMADGCNNREGFTISLQEEDKYILEEFKKRIGYNGPIRLNKPKKSHWKDMYVLAIYSMKLSSDLSVLGVIPNKTHFTEFPNISKDLYRHFIRGYFDGDGCININIKKAGNVSIIGNILLIEKIKQILDSVIQNEMNISKNSIKYTNNIKTISTMGNVNCKLIAYYLYNDATIFLTRKKEKFDEIEVVRCKNRLNEKLNNLK